MLKKQSFFLQRRDLSPDNTCTISRLGLDYAEGVVTRQGKSWQRHQACRQDTFVLNVLESYSESESVGYTRQEDYIKINFWLSGRHTTVLDGFVQHDHERPEVFITAGPQEMIKVDLCGRDTHVASVALCVLRDFFPLHMGLTPERLPEPLRGIVAPQEIPYAFHRFSLTPDLLTATRAILAAPMAVRKDSVYTQAKAVELMCLLINRIGAENRLPGEPAEIRVRKESRLYEARELLTRHFAEDITLERISREVGLNRMALTSGFRQLFGMSVYDYLQKERMQHAYELLQDESNTIAQVAEAVGYGHSCNFSTAFHAYFGCSPQKARSLR